MADYKEAYNKVIRELTEVIDELTRVRNNAIKFVIKTKSEENKKENAIMKIRCNSISKISDTEL